MTYLEGGCLKGVCVCMHASACVHVLQGVKEKHIFNLNDVMCVNWSVI